MGRNAVLIPDEQTNGSAACLHPLAGTCYIYSSWW